MPALAEQAPKTASFGERLSALAEPLFAFALARAAREAALDAVQDALAAAVTAARAGKAWADDEALWAWLLVVTRNKLVDEHRKGKTRSVTLGALGIGAEAIEQTLLGGRTPPPDAAQRGELAMYCRAALSELPPRQQRALEAVYRDQCDYGALGAELGLGAAGAKSLVQRARLALLESLKRKFARPEESL